MRVFTLIMSVLLAWPVPAGSTESGIFFPSRFEASLIQQIWQDGTVILSNGKKLKCSREALVSSSMRQGDQIWIYTKEGLVKKDSRGRMIGWLLIMDPIEPVESLIASLPKESDPAAAPPLGDPLAGMRDDLLGPQIQFSFRNMEMASRSTVSPPAGEGFRWLAQFLITPGGRVFLENGREIRLGKNVLKSEFAKQSRRLIFGAVPADNTADLVQELRSA